VKKFEIYEFIQRQPQDVFDYFSDPANLADWQANTDYAEWVSSGNPGVGSKFKVVTMYGGSPSQVLLQVTIWDRPNCYAFKSIDTPFPLKKLEGITTLTPKNNGTHLVFKGEIAFSSFFKLGESLISKQAIQQDGSNIVMMKQVLESGSSLRA
jgi:hypothetical protein